MLKYLFLGSIYLIAVVSSSIANSIQGDVQKLYRVPFLNIRWIDISILIIILSFLYNLTRARTTLKNTSLINSLCFVYLIFETLQLLRSWGFNDATAQVSHFLCTLSLFIVIDLSTYPVPIDRIIHFLRRFAVWGAVAIIISNLYLLYSFFSGGVTHDDLGVRVVLEVAGSKETVYSYVLTPFVYAFGLYLIHKADPLWEKALFLCAILSIFGSQVITVYRGTLVTLLCITVYFIASSANAKQTIFKIASILFLMCLGYLVLGPALTNKGYDPITKIVETTKFATDITNPNWDKGRSVSQKYAIAGWKENLWFGAGYDELGDYGLPEGVATAHNGVITSLFHRGIIGTILLMFILMLLFKYAVNLWFILKRKDTYQDEMIKLLILTSSFWIIPFMTQEALWEKYSLSIEFMYLGLILNYYRQFSKKTDPVEQLTTTC